MASPPLVTATERTNPSTIWHNTIFWRLWLGLSISVVGDSFLWVALQHAEYTHTQSAGVIATMTAAMMTGWVCMSMFGGTLVDRFNRRHLMIAADSARALLLCLLIVLLRWQLGGTAGGERWGFMLLLPTLTLLTAFTAIFQPALTVSLPTLVDLETLPQANAWISTSQKVAQVTGYALAGGFVVLASATGALLFDAGTFLVSLLCVLWAGPFGAPARTIRPPFWADFREGVRFIGASRQIRACIGEAVAVNVLAGIFLALVMPVAAERLGTAPWVWGLVMAGNALGGIVAALGISPWLARQAQRRGQFAVGFLALQGLVQTAFAVSPWLWVSLSLSVLNGLCVGCFNLMIVRYFQVEIPAEIRGRVWGLYMTAVQVTVPLAAAVAGPLALLAGSASLVYTLAGALLTVLALLLLKLPGMREI